MTRGDRLSEKEKQYWIAASEDDWEVALLLVKASRFPAAVFHFQQAAEKALKAVCLEGRRPAFTHSCVELLEKIRSMGTEVGGDLLYAARRLETQYVVSRYPNGAGSAPADLYDETIIAELQECARMLTSFAASKLSTKDG